MESCSTPLVSAGDAMSDAVLDSLANQITVIDSKGDILYVNRAWHEFAVSNGIPADYQWIGRNYLNVCRNNTSLQNDESDSALVYAGIFDVVKGVKDAFVYEYPCHSLTEKRWFLMRIGHVWGKSGLFVVSHHNITARVLVEEEVRHLAFYDPLTNLPNRRLLMDRLKQAIATTHRTGQHGALMFLDLDYFKQLNDKLGHAIGDELLKQVAERLQSCVREVDSVARFGGDEFVVLLEALSHHDLEAAGQTEAIAAKILKALGHPYTLGSHIYKCTPSVGIVIFQKEQKSQEELIRRADAAMYKAKIAGRNTIRFHSNNE